MRGTRTLMAAHYAAYSGKWCPGGCSAGTLEARHETWSEHTHARTQTHTRTHTRTHAHKIRRTYSYSIPTLPPEPHY